LPSIRTISLLALAVTAAALAWSTGRGATPAAAAKCSRPGGPGLIGEEVLLEQGFTTGEVEGVLTAVDHLAEKICPFPEFVAVVEDSLHQTHVDRDTVWRYTFKLDASPGRTYKTTCLIPGLDHMKITIKAPSGKTLYRGRLRTEGL
jgi:hypothetical protein